MKGGVEGESEFVKRAPARSWSSTTHLSTMNPNAGEFKPEFPAPPGANPAAAAPPPAKGAWGKGPPPKSQVIALLPSHARAFASAASCPCSPSILLAPTKCASHMLCRRCGSPAAGVRCSPHVHSSVLTFVWLFPIACACAAGRWLRMLPSRQMRLRSRRISASRGNSPSGKLRTHELRKHLYSRAHSYHQGTDSGVKTLREPNSSSQHCEQVGDEDSTVVCVGGNGSA